MISHMTTVVTGRGWGGDSLRHGQFRQGIIIESYGWLYGWLSERLIEGLA